MNAIEVGDIVTDFGNSEIGLIPFLVLSRNPATLGSAFSLPELVAWHLAQDIGSTGSKCVMQ